MATEIRTIYTYPLDGSTLDYVIPFEYLARKFIKVSLIGEDRKELVLNIDYRIVDKKKVTLNRPWSPSDGYQYIEIRRFTSVTERLVDFNDGSILRAADLNISQIQTLHVAEEARDLMFDTLSMDLLGNLDAKNRRIIRVADAVEDGDAVNLGMIKGWDMSAYNQAERAKREADRAEAAGTTVITPLKRVKLEIKASDITDGTFLLPIMPVDCQLYLQGKILQHESLGHYELVGSLLKFKGKIFEWDFFTVYLNTEILGYDESRNDV